MLALVYEIGGSNTRAALVNTATLEVLFEARSPTPNFHSHGSAGIDGLLEALAATIRDLAQSARSHGQADLVAIGYPGPVSPDGIALSSPTLLGASLDRHLDIADLVRRATGLRRMVAMNDVTACGFRYVADGETDFALINVGSGVGNKLFVRGNPVIGPGGRGGEFGHFTVDMRPDAPLCECGGRGHLAGISSGRGVERAVRQAARQDPPGFRGSALGADDRNLHLIDTPAIVAAFRGGDEWTIHHVATATRPLAHAMAGLHTATGTESFILVGGFALALGPAWSDLLAVQCAAACWNLGQDWQRMVRLGEPGDRDGLIGLAFAAGRDLA
ncbi:ROK family protein [Mesorhizobium australicum]|uniref:ROK family protein n=1 Tax=Mesorhizobium australicum TaxID=536018 RepID=UPI00333655D3